MTTTEEALGEYLVERHVIEPGCPPEDWYKGSWFYIYTAGRKVPFFPTFGFKRGLAQHDVDHMLSGYDTSWTGEGELAAWELASGGCGTNVMFWLDRLFFLPIAFLMAPIRAARAFRRGLHCRNAFRLRRDEMLAMDVEELRRYVAV